MSKTKNPIAATMEHMMPVGTIIEWCPVEGSGVDLSTPAKVAAYYGFGTWEAYGAGRATVGTTSSHEPGETWGGSTNNPDQCKYAHRYPAQLWERGIKR